MVRRHPEWLADDGVHVSAEGYRARARAVANGPPLRDAPQLSDGSAGIVAISL